MSIHQKDTGWLVRWRDPSGINRGITLPGREEAEAFDERMKEENQRRRAEAAASAPPSSADAARYDRDFEALLRFGSAHCFYDDPNWRRAMRKRARANGISVRTMQTSGSEGGTLLSAWPTGYEVDHEGTIDPDWQAYRKKLTQEAAEHARRHGMKVAR